jgi:hypothetical protein
MMKSLPMAAAGVLRAQRAVVMGLLGVLLRQPLRRGTRVAEEVVAPRAISWSR